MHDESINPGNKKKEPLPIEVKLSILEAVFQCITVICLSLLLLIGKPW